MHTKMLHMNPGEKPLAYYGVRSGEGFSHLPLLPLWLTFQQINILSNCRPNDVTIAGLPNLASNLRLVFHTWISEAMRILSLSSKIHKTTY